MKQLLIATLVMLLAACAQTPDWDYDRSVNFAQYKQFTWINNARLSPDGAPYQVSELMEKRVRKAIVGELGAKGIHFVAPDKADLLVNYHMSVDTKVDIDTVSLGYGMRWNYWGLGYNTHTTAQEYDVGTLVIDLVDKKTNQLIWRGAKEGRLRSKQTPEERTEAVNKAVAEILANYPPKAQ